VVLQLGGWTWGQLLALKNNVVMKCYAGLRTWTDSLKNIKMGLREIGWGGMDCVDLTEDRDQLRALVNAIMNIRVSLYIGEFLNS
jgi:hypothetical protein